MHKFHSAQSRLENLLISKNRFLVNDKHDHNITFGFLKFIHVQVVEMRENIMIFLERVENSVQIGDLLLLPTLAALGIDLDSEEWSHIRQDIFQQIRKYLKLCIKNSI